MRLGCGAGNRLAGTCRSRGCPVHSISPFGKDDSQAVDFHSDRFLRWFSSGLGPNRGWRLQAGSECVSLALRAALDPGPLGSLYRFFSLESPVASGQALWRLSLGRSRGASFVCRRRTSGGLHAPSRIREKLPASRVGLGGCGAGALRPLQDARPSCAPQGLNFEGLLPVQRNGSSQAGGVSE